MEVDGLVAMLDDYFRTRDWSSEFALVYPEPYWRDYVEPDYEGHWNGLQVRGADDVRQAVTCVFPSDRIVSLLQPATLLFSIRSTSRTSLAFCRSRSRASRPCASAA